MILCDLIDMMLILCHLIGIVMIRCENSSWKMLSFILFQAVLETFDFYIASLAIES